MLFPPSGLSERECTKKDKQKKKAARDVRERTNKNQKEGSERKLYGIASKRKLRIVS